MNYVCTQELPAEISGLETVEITSDKIPNIGDAMPFTSVLVGRYYNDTKETASFFTVDKDKAYEDTVFARMLKNGFEFEKVPATICRKDSGEMVGVTDYFIIYKNPNARHFLPTAPSVVAACNVESDCTYEVVLATDDGAFKSYIYINYKTGGMGSMNLLDCIDDLEDILTDAEALVESVPGAYIDKEYDCVFVPFTNIIGNYEMFEFGMRRGGRVEELKDMVVSIRMIHVDTRIVGDE